MRFRGFDGELLEVDMPSTITVAVDHRRRDAALFLLGLLGILLLLATTQP